YYRYCKKGDCPIHLFRSITKRQWSLILLTIILILTFYFILPISIPLIVAFVSALILNPAVRMLQRRMRVKRKTAVMTVFFLFLIAVVVLGTFVVTKAVAQVVHFVENVPIYFNELNEGYRKWEARFENYAQHLPSEFVEQVTGSIKENITALSQTAKEKITLNNIAQNFTKVPQYLISFLDYLLALFLCMLELPVLKTKAYHMLTEETARKVSFMNERLSDVILGFLKAQFLVSIIIFLVSLAGLLLITPQVALIMSLIIWIIDLIPIVGSIIILGPWALFMFLSGDIEMGVKLTVLAGILLIIRRTIEPKLMGQHIGLSPLATLIAMFLGLKLLGVLGFILGPLVVIVFTSAKEAGIIKWNVKI